MKVTTLESARRVPFQLDGRIMLSNKHVEAIHLCLHPGKVLPAHINDLDVAVFVLEGEGIIASGCWLMMLLLKPNQMNLMHIALLL